MNETPPSKSPYSQAGSLGSGLQFAVTIALCAYGGWWIDARWETSPWILIGGCLFGSVGGFYHLYRTLVDDSSSGQNKKDADIKDAEETTS